MPRLRASSAAMPSSAAYSLGRTRDQGRFIFKLEIHTGVEMNPALGKTESILVDEANCATESFLTLVALQQL